MRADFLVYDPKGNLAALVGVIASPETSIAWAVESLSDFLKDGERPPYLVLIARDHAYFWRSPADNPTPLRVVATNVLLDKYLRALGKPVTDVHYSTLEMMVFDWLVDVTWRLPDPPELLRATGFTDAIRDGRIELPNAA